MRTDPKRCPHCLRTYLLAQSFCPFDGETLSSRSLSELVHGRPSGHASGLFAERYAVRGQLGRGAMTHVLLGEDIVTHEPVAIKVLDASFLRRVEVVERFVRESEALQRIDNPYVVRSLATGMDTEGLPFHVLEHLQGESLDLLLKREPVLAPKLVLRILIQCASALEAVHRRGVLHRDIKPSNLMIVGDTHQLRGVKLIDFGFAHVNGSSIQTPPGTALGTVAYMAPEQIVGDQIDGRCDLYGLGVLAFRLLTGKLPFSGEGLDLMAQQLLLPVPSVREIDSSAPEGLVRVIAHAVRKDPAHRYPSARHMKEDLLRIVVGEEEVRRNNQLESDDYFVPSPGLPQQAAQFLAERLGVVPPWQNDLQENVGICD